MIGETGDPKLTSLVNQMCYKQDLSNNIFDSQLHFKTTAAFIVNKLFYYKFDLYKHKTYTFVGNIC